MGARQRLLTLVGALVMVLAGGLTILAQDAPTPTPSAVASPDASPGASPDASPQASPMASPEAIVGNVEEGKKLATQCLGCHSVEGGTLVGPTWKDLYGEEVELEDGTVVIADDAYLMQSIKDPTSQIVKGFPPAMPPYAYLSDTQINDLIAYIKSLSDEGDDD